MNPTSILPDKMSDLIDIALIDLELCEQDPEHYIIDMRTYYTKANGKCEVCLAGAVMVQTLECATVVEINRLLWGEHNVRLLAIDRLRIGNISSAAYLLGLDADHVEALRCYNTIITQYSVNKDEFKSQMKILSATLRAQGY